MTRMILSCLMSFAFCTGIRANSSSCDFTRGDTLLSADGKTMFLVVIADTNNNYFVSDSAPRQSRENKKAIAAVLAFPFPFGLLGLHRVYLGTKPYMPFVYLGTLGGCLGILPLIDFIAILTSDKEKLKSFENNPKVFMWSH